MTRPITKPIIDPIHILESGPCYVYLDVFSCGGKHVAKMWRFCVSIAIEATHPNLTTDKGLALGVSGVPVFCNIFICTVE